jgi:hypothetical protein
MRRIFFLPLRWPQEAWYICTKFHDDGFRNSSNINGINSTIWEAIVLVLLMRWIYDVRCWNWLRWHKIHTKFHKDRFRHLSAITAITATIWEPIIFVLLTEGIGDVYCWGGFMRSNIHTKFRDDRFRNSSNVKVLPDKFDGCNFGILMEGNY